MVPDTTIDRPPRLSGAPAPPTRPPGRARRLVRYLLISVTAVLVVDALVGEKGLLALLQARRESAAVERALERSREDNKQLRDHARRLKEDPTAIEAIARRDLGLIKPGEKLIIVKDIAPR
jgi:cell division protein FtsB